MTADFVLLWLRRLFFSLLCLGALYLVVWFSGAFLVAQRVESLWSDASGTGMVPEENLPRVSGFPGPYRLFWQGEIITPAARIDTSALSLSGWPLPGATLSFNLPFGGTVELPARLSKAIPQKKFTFTRLQIDVRVPPHLPGGPWTHKTASMLARNKVRLEIPHLSGELFLLNKETPVAFSGSAWVELDPQLQPRGLMTLDISQPSVVRNILLSLVQAPVARSLVSGLIGSLSRPDSITGESVLPLTLRVENRHFYVGMFQVADLPEIVWPMSLPPSPEGPIPVP